MPITGQGWEILIERKLVQTRGSRSRTVGSYQVYHAGQPVPGLAGTTAESPGPGSNAVAGNKKRVEAGRYPLWTQDGTKYDTLGYVESESLGVRPKPGIELMGTGNRGEIIIHPGLNSFLSSVGCINLCTRLQDASVNIDYPGSRRRVIALIDDMKQYLGNAFPARNGLRIPNAWAQIDGEP